MRWWLGLLITLMLLAGASLYVYSIRSSIPENRCLTDPLYQQAPKANLFVDENGLVLMPYNGSPQSLAGPTFLLAASSIEDLQLKQAYSLEHFPTTKIYYGQMKIGNQQFPAFFFIERTNIYYYSCLS